MRLQASGRVVRLLLVALVFEGVWLQSCARASLTVKQAASVSDSDATGEVVRSSLPASVRVLREDTIDELLFSPGAEPWVVFFFSPSCKNCKRDLPAFVNASRDAHAGPHVAAARFGLVDVKESPQLRERFFIRAYPTMIYSTAQGRNWYVYEGGRTAQAFAQFATDLHRAAAAGGFAVDVTDPVVFAQHTSSHSTEKGFRMPFYALVPSHAACNASASCAGGVTWSAALDGLPTLVPMSLYVLHESRLPPHWRETAGADYVRIVEQGLACVRQSAEEPEVMRGPDGAVLLAGDDAYRSVRCYHGPWRTSPKLTTQTQRALRKTRSSARHRIWEQIARDMPPQPHAQLREFVYRHGYRAVEDVVDTALLSSLRRDGVHYVGVLLTRGPVTQTDTHYLPTLREVARDTNEVMVDAEERRVQHDVRRYYNAKATRKRLRGDVEVVDPVSQAGPTVNWVVVDGVARVEWREQFDLTEEQLPALFIVDTVRDRTYRLTHVDPDFDRVKDTVPWTAVHGASIRGFVERVLGQKLWPEKSTRWGVMAEYFVMLPLLGRFFGLLDYEPGTFVIFVTCLLATLLSVSIVVGLEVRMELRAERERNAARKAKND